MFVRDKISFKRGWFDRFAFQRWKKIKKGNEGKKMH